MWEFVAMAFAAFLGASAQVLFRKGMPSVNLLLVGTGLLIYGIAFLINVLVYRSPGVQASKLYPVIALSYIFLAIMASIYLGEQLTWGKVVGAVCIIGGVVMMYAL